MFFNEFESSFGILLKECFYEEKLRVVFEIKKLVLVVFVSVWFYVMVGNINLFCCK